MIDRVGWQFGNYRLIRLLGQGSFAEVYLSEQIYLKSLSAVKVLFTSQSDSTLTSFFTEARIIARLVHPNIVRILEFGVEDDKPFLVMDYAPNGNLRQHHPKAEPLALSTIISYVNQVAKALQYAHDNEVIHRDIKPENMLLGQNNDVLLSDFGIALITSSSRSQTQSIRQIAGTLAYMAPEQIQGEPCPASDQYAMGVVVYEWLTGTQPFSGSPMEIAFQHEHVPPPHLRGKVPTLSRYVEDVVLVALEKDPGKRFSSVQEFALALAQAVLFADTLDQVGRSAQPRPIGESATTSQPDRTSGERAGADSKRQTLPPPTGAWIPPNPYEPTVVAPGNAISPTVKADTPFRTVESGRDTRNSSVTYGNPYNAYETPASPPPRSRRGGLPFPSLKWQRRSSSRRQDQILRENLQFTAYHPRIIAVEEWKPLLIYAHIASAVQAIHADAAKFKELGPMPREVHTHARRQMIRGTEITLIPRCQGVTFEPERISFKWVHDWERIEFTFQAEDRELVGTASNGEIIIYAGPLIIATLKLGFLIEEQSLPFSETANSVQETAYLYKQIFTSYSHDDTPVVLACRNAYKALGFNVLIDIDTLRSGQQWSKELMRMIDASDIFQLFWSERAARSQFVRQEWEYAIKHSKGDGFIRPVYWETPLVPPPAELSMLHFDQVELPRLEPSNLRTAFIRSLLSTLVQNRRTIMQYLLSILIQGLLSIFMQHLLNILRRDKHKSK